MSATISTPAFSSESVTPIDETIVLYKGQSQYDVLRVMIEDLAEGFKSLGYKTEIIDLMETEALDKLQQVKGKIKCFISFNGNGLGIDVKGVPIYDVLHIPLIAWHVDHPFYLKARLCAPIENMIQVISNQNNYEFYVNEYRLPGTISKCLQLGGARKVDRIIPYAERTNGLVFFGSYSNNLDDMKENLKLGNPAFQTLLSSTAEEALFEEERELYEIFYSNLEKKGVAPNDLPKDNLMPVMAAIDDYVRTYRRTHVLKALKDFPITIYGNGWEKFDKSHKHNMTLLPAQGFVETNVIMANSKLVLNIMPNNRTGIHDRLTYACHQGTACLSEYTPGIAETFTHDKDIFLYHMTPDLEGTLYSQVDSLMNNPDKMEAVAEQGRINIEANFNWKSRAKELVNLAEGNELMKVLKNVNGYKS